jgi:hypothetical protein
MRYRPNKFKAKPERHAGPVMRGVYTHPGFHTTGMIEVAACYAQAHVVTSMGYETDETLADYPVIVTLDMHGLSPLADYDAEETLWPAVRDLLREFFRMNPEGDEHDLSSWLEVDVSEGREPLGRGDSATEALFRVAGWRIENPYSALYSSLDALGEPHEVMEMLRELADGSRKPSDELLCALADQYRYIEDVSEARVVAVDFMRPFWPALLDYQAAEDDDDEGEAERIESAGWAVMDVENVYDDRVDIATSRVYAKRSKTKRPEYHGTSYLNVLSAAPRIAKKLPVPPPPFQGAK